MLKQYSSSTIITLFYLLLLTIIISCIQCCNPGWTGPTCTTVIKVSNVQVLEANATSTTAVLQWDYDMNAKDVLFQVCVDCAKTNFTCQTSLTRNIKLQELRTSHSCIATIKAIINETSSTGVIAPTIYTLPPDPVNFRYFATSDNFEVTYDEISDRTSPGFIEFHYYVCPAWSSCMGFNIYQPPGYGFRYMQSSTSFNFTLRTQYSSPVQRVSKLTASLTVTTLPTVPSDFTFFNITDSSVSFSWGTVSAGNEAPITYFVCHTSGMYCNSTLNNFITIKDLKFATDYTFELFAQNARNVKSNSATKSLTTKFPIPKILQVNSKLLQDDSVNLNWIPNYHDNSTSYNVCLIENNKVIDCKNITTTFIVINSLNSSSIYDFNIRAKNSIGYSIENLKYSVTTLPLKVSNFTTLNVNSSQITLIWNEVNGGNVGGITYSICSNITIWAINKVGLSSNANETIIIKTDSYPITNNTNNDNQHVTPGTNGSGTNVGAIVGGVIGGVVLLLAFISLSIAVVALLFFKFKN